MKKVFVYGCFDILHTGHLKFLKGALKFGDELYVGILPNEYIKSFKGQSRPIFDESDRLQIVKSLKFIKNAQILQKEEVFVDKKFDLSKIEQEVCPYILGFLSMHKIDVFVLPSNIKISAGFKEILKAKKITLKFVQNKGEISTSKIIEKLNSSF